MEEWSICFDAMKSGEINDELFTVHEHDASECRIVIESQSKKAPQRKWVVFASLRNFLRGL
jgi:HKD family nuclease